MSRERKSKNNNAIKICFFLYKSQTKLNQFTHPVPNFVGQEHFKEREDTAHELGWIDVVDGFHSQRKRILHSTHEYQRLEVWKFNPTQRRQGMNKRFKKS